MFYFHNLQDISNLYEQLLYFPIKQIETYKNIITKTVIDSLMGIPYNCYFPAWYFVNLPEKWEYNLTADYLYGIEKSYDYIKYIRSILEAMNEPCLYSMNVPDNMEIYRFTWLRSFHDPICIRIEKCGNNIQLYFNRISEIGGNGKGKSIKSKKRSISNSEWNSFIELLNNANFDKLPKMKEIIMCDGAEWMLEKKTANKFKVYDTNKPEGFFKEACIYLIKLSKIKIKEDEIY